MSKADVIKEIADERRRQIEREGWTPEHDNEHGDGSLARAAACYAAGERLWCAAAAYRYNELWPWEDAAWKPKDRRRDLIRVFPAPPDLAVRGRFALGAGKPGPATEYTEYTEFTEFTEKASGFGGSGGRPRKCHYELLRWTRCVRWLHPYGHEGLVIR